MTGLLALVLSFVMSLALAAAFLGVLFVVVRAAVEQGVRRALPDSALRPDVRARLAEGHLEWTAPPGRGDRSV